MRAHIVENGVVVNTIEVDSLNAIPGLIDGDIGGIGWLWDGENLTPPAPDTEAQWAVIRTERNKLLVDSDWTQLPDAPVDAAVWATYRQELRDITTQADPFAIVWPESPTT
jgi:kynurenine formamidase